MTPYLGMYIFTAAWNEVVCILLAAQPHQWTRKHNGRVIGEKSPTGTHRYIKCETTASLFAVIASRKDETISSLSELCAKADAEHEGDQFEAWPAARRAMAKKRHRKRITDRLKTFSDFDLVHLDIDGRLRLGAVGKEVDLLLETPIYDKAEKQKIVRRLEGLMSRIADGAGFGCDYTGSCASDQGDCGRAGDQTGHCAPPLA